MAINDQQKPLSAQLDEALHRESFYRELLLFWKRRRQRIEEQISLPIDELSAIAEEAFNGQSGS